MPLGIMDVMGAVKVQQLHPWDVSPREARGIQQRLAPMVSHQNHLSGQVRFVAGMDVSPPDERGLVRGAVVVLAYPSLEPVEVSVAEAMTAFPYVPGLLSFRETPVLIKALEGLQVSPDIMILDAQGYAHPRRFGLACHIGLLADIPTIGCAKSLLIGKHGDLKDERGACAELLHNGEVIGMAVRTRPGTRPVYVSVGHKVDLPTGVDWVLACCRGYRLPQTTRLAHTTAGGAAPPIIESAHHQTALI